MLLVRGFLGFTELPRFVPKIFLAENYHPWCRGAKDNEGFGFALSAWLILSYITGCLCCVSLCAECLTVFAFSLVHHEMEFPPQIWLVF